MKPVQLHNVSPCSCYRSPPLSRHVTLVLASEFWNTLCINLPTSHCVYLTMLLIIPKSAFQIQPFSPLWDCYGNFTWKIKAVRGHFTFISSFCWGPKASKTPRSETSLSAQTFEMPWGLQGTEGVQAGASYHGARWSLEWGPKSCQHSGCLAGVLPVQTPLLGLSRAEACQGFIETGQKRSYRSTFSNRKTLSWEDSVLACQLLTLWRLSGGTG